MKPSDIPAHIVEAGSLRDRLLEASTGAAVPGPAFVGARHRHRDDCRIDGVVVGELVALTDAGTTPLVCYPGQPGTAALRARTTVDLHAAHILRQVVLMFEEGDASRPIIMGLIHGGSGWPLEEKPAVVDVDADGARMSIAARDQLVLKCGNASITLTKAGEVLIEGTFVLSKSSGVNRIKGGSIRLN